MEVILIFLLVYILSVMLSFIGVWFWNASYRKKCKTLYQFLFEPEYGDDASNAFAVFAPGINMVILFAMGFRALTMRIPLNKK